VTYDVPHVIYGGDISIETWKLGRIHAIMKQKTIDGSIHSKIIIVFVVVVVDRRQDRWGMERWA